MAVHEIHQHFFFLTQSENYPVEKNFKVVYLKFVKERNQLSSTHLFKSTIQVSYKETRKGRENQIP